MKVFISGPITGTSDYKERFARAEEYLRGLGHTVINPVKLTEALPEEPWETYMEITIVGVRISEAIYMLKGWQSSKGAKIEHKWAEATNKAIQYEAAGWIQ